MGYEAKVIEDSVSNAGVRLTTLVVTLPRIVLAEFNTHRMLSRNSASSRAIPVEKRIKAVEEDPFVPEQFGKNQRGMQAGAALEGGQDEYARETWMYALGEAVMRARQLAEVGVHKQLANRLIEPFCWHTIVVTATEWSNFFALRCHPNAQPEIRKAAEMMRDAMAASTPRKVIPGLWHRPFVELEDIEAMHASGVYDNLVMAKVSAARCARVSYLTHDGKRDYREDLALADKLLENGHMSPFEHPATPLVGRREFDMLGNFQGWRQYRKTIPLEDNFADILSQREADAAFAKVIEERRKGGAS